MTIITGLKERSEYMDKEKKSLSLEQQKVLWRSRTLRKRLFSDIWSKGCR